jgi:hypothetical protein
VEPVEFHEGPSVSELRAEVMGAWRRDYITWTRAAKAGRESAVHRGLIQLDFSSALLSGCLRKRVVNRKCVYGKGAGTARAWQASKR